MQCFLLRCKLLEPHPAPSPQRPWQPWPVHGVGQLKHRLPLVEAGLQVPRLVGANVEVRPWEAELAKHQAAQGRQRKMVYFESRGLSVSYQKK